MRSFVRLSLLLVSLALLSAGEPADPLRDLRGRSLITVLAQTRSQLAERRNDPAYWATITRTYALLALHTEPDMWGVYGPWWDYAHRARTALIAARGRPANDLGEALPELWVNLIDHENTTIVAVLDRFDPAGADPEAQALRAMACAKPELAVGDAPVTNFAKASAGKLSGQRAALNCPSTGQDPWSFAVLRMRSSVGYDRNTLIRSVLSDTVWMLQSPELPDGTALPLLRDLITACAGTPAPGATRAELFKAAETAVRRCSPQEAAPKLLAVSWRCCLAALAVGSTGWSAEGTTTLVGLGDVARWNRDRHYLLPLYVVMNDSQEEARKLLAAIEPVTGFTLGLGRLAFHDESLRHRLAEALAQDLAKPATDRFPPPIHAVALARIAEADEITAARLAPAVLAEYAPNDRRALIELSHGCLNIGRGDLVHQRTAAMAADSPWYWEVAKVASATDQAKPLLNLGDRKPDETWIDATVDVGSRPENHRINPAFTAIRWNGTIDLPKPGTWTLAIESDDGSRLHIGALDLDNGGDHPMQRREIEIAGPAKDLPLRIEFYNRTGGMGCRLWWRAPDESAPSIVPAAYLHHGDALGLEAELFNFADEQALDAALAPTDIAFAAFTASNPGNALAFREHADELRRHRSWAAAAAAYHTTAKLLSPDHADHELRDERIQCHILAHEFTEAARLMASDGWWSLDNDDFDQLLFACALLQPSEAAKLVDAFTALPESKHCGSSDLVVMQCAMACGNYPAAIKAGRRVLPNGPNLPARCSWRKEGILLTILLSRTFEPEWKPAKPVDTQMTFCCDSDMFTTAGRWLAGKAEWEQVLATESDQQHLAELGFIHALYTMSIGNHDGAQAELRDVLTRLNPSNTYHPFAQACLAWYARQTPEQLKSLRGSPPLGSKATPLIEAPATPGPAVDAKPPTNDF